MHRITRSALVTDLYLTIKTAPKTVQSKLRSKLAMDSDEGARMLAQAIAEKIDNQSRMVIATEMVVTDQPCDARPGKWGEHEPDPCVDQ